MSRSAIGGVLLVLVSIALVGGSATAQKAPTGAKWDYTIFDEKDKVVEKGVFFARGQVLFNRNNVRIGTYEDVSPTHIKLLVTDGKLKGKLDLKREDPKALTWKGELERVSGRQLRVTFSFEKLR
jgi:hypothetical protein